MGYIKSFAENRELLGLGKSVDKQVCSNHIKEEVICKHIQSNGDKGYCDYCKTEGNVLPMDDLMVFIMKGINRLYTDAANFMSYDSREEGYFGKTYTGDELMEDVIGLDINNAQLQDDINSSIADRAWASDYWDRHDKIMNAAWRYFKFVVKHKSRYFPSGKFRNDDTGEDVMTILGQIGSIVLKYNLYTSLSANTALFRCRLHAPSPLYPASLMIRILKISFTYRF